MAILRAHVDRFGVGADGRLFRSGVPTLGALDVDLADRKEYLSDPTEAQWALIGPFLQAWKARRAPCGADARKSLTRQRPSRMVDAYRWFRMSWHGGN